MPTLGNRFRVVQKIRKDIGGHSAELVLITRGRKSLFGKRHDKFA